MEKENAVEFKVYGKYALFSDPITRVGGEKMTYSVPTYEAIKGIVSSIYWKPTIIWIIDSVRVINKIQTESKGIRPIDMKGGNTLSMYTYLKDVEYRVKAHFIWNENRPELSKDRNENKHYFIFKRMLEKGGRRDIFLGTRECQGYVEPCKFNEGIGEYDNSGNMNLGIMLHGITYADEAYSEETKNNMTVRFTNCVMENGVINFEKPEDCKITRCIRKMEMKKFGEDNFSGLGEFDKNFFEQGGE